MREIQPLDQDARPVDPIYTKGKHSGHYMMEQLIGDDGSKKWVVKGQLGKEGKDPYFRIGAWDYRTAQQVLFYTVEHDVSFRTALYNLYINGEPDLLCELLEKAKATAAVDREVVFDIELRGFIPREVEIESVRIMLQNCLRDYYQRSRFHNFKTRGLVEVKVDSYDA